MLWEADPDTLVHVREGANSVQAFRAGGRSFFLRLTSDRHRARDQLEAELDFVRFLASRGLGVSHPYQSRNARWVETIDVDGDVWHAVAFVAVPGSHFRFFSADVDRPLFHAWGETMAALHVASRDFVPASTRRRPHWSAQDTTSCDAGRITLAEIAAHREHALISAWLATRPVTPERWGLIHGDFERTNFVLEHGLIRVYDFDDACYHWYVADIAHALWAFRNAPPDDRARFLAWFLEGYRVRGPIEPDVREQLSWFVRLRTLSLFIARLHAAPSTDDWLTRARRWLATPFRW
jgi:Ser/Thr protein kinase RdoA (MazF antagonist)